MSAERVIVVVRPRTILLAVALALLAIGAVVMVNAAAQVLERVVVAGTLAALLRPLTLRFARRMPLGIAAALTVLVVIVGFALLTAVEIRDLVAETGRLKQAVPARIERLRTGLQPENAVRRFIEQANVEPRVREWLGQLPARIVLGTDNPAAGASRITGALLVTILTIFTITRGPQSVEGAIGLFRHRRVRRALERVVTAAYQGGTRYTRRTLALAVVSGAVAAVVAQVLHVPAPSVLGLWVGVWSLIPVLGLVVGYVPIIGLAAAESRGRGWVAAVVLVVWLGVAALARRRWIAERSVDLSRLLLTVAVMTGLHVGRITGAVVGVFLAAAFGAALAEARRINLSGDLTRGLDELFTVPAPATGAGPAPGPAPAPAPAPGTP